MKKISLKVFIGSALTLIFVGIVTTAAFFALSSIKYASQKNIQESLHTVLHTTRDALHTWMRFRQDDINETARQHSITDLSQALLIAHNNGQTLIASPHLTALRRLLAPKLAKHADKGFFIIAPDRISIASMRDSNIGSENVINLHRKNYLDRVFTGETLFIPTVHSDVPLNTSSGVLRERLPTIFIAAPIKDAGGQIIAALAFRLDPSSDFSRITQLGRLGDSGETYAFDERATLITESRFDEQLRRIGLLSLEDTSVLSLRIIDPGGNLLEGFRLETALEQQPLTLMVNSAIQGASSHNIEGYRDYRGVTVVGNWLWDDMLGFGMATEIDIDEAMRPYHQTRNTVIMVLMLTVLLSFGLLLLLLMYGQNAKAILKKANALLEERIDERTRELAESEQKFRTIFESSADAMVLMNTTRFLDCNDATVKLFRCRNREEFLVRAPRDWLATTHPNARGGNKTQIDRHVARAISQGQHSFECTHIRADGDPFPTEVLYTPLHMNGDIVIQSTLRDISERKQAEEELASLHQELERLSFLDGLTGIANRRMFDQTLDKEWNRAKRHHQSLSLILIDIDYFKQFNDTYGHQQGDNCLKQVAMALTTVLKRAGDLVARYGGEEFVLLLPDTDAQQAARLAELAREAIHRLHIPHKSSLLEGRVTISIGVSTLAPASGNQPKSLLAIADQLLYRAKEMGRDRVEAQS